MPIPAVIAGLLASPHFIPALIAGGYLGGTALGQIGKAGERKTALAQIEMQKLLAERETSAAKKSVEESRKRTQEYMQQILKNQQLQSFMQSQDRQVALLMQAIQGISANRPTYQPSSGGGMIGLMRGEY